MASGPTYGDFIDDILMTLGMTHDDAVLHRAAAAYNMGIIIDRIKTQRLRKAVVSGASTRGITDMVTTYIVPIASETYLNGRNYFTLPGEILNIPMNGGIEYITYANNSDCDKALIGKPFNLCTPGEVHNLNADAFQRPSPAVPYYYRARLQTATDRYDDRVWVLGPGPSVGYLEVGLYLSLGNIETIDPDAPMDLPADLIYLVKRAMLDMSRWLLLVPQQRLRNDGRDFGVKEQPLQPPQGISVNDPLNSTAED